MQHHYFCPGYGDPERLLLSIVYFKLPPGSSMNCFFTQGGSGGAKYCVFVIWIP